MPTYSSTKDPSVVSVLERGDIFLGTRRTFKNGQYLEHMFKYRVLYPAVYFEHSGNWVMRCKGRFRKKLKEEFEIVEHLVFNHQCIHKYKFNIGDIMTHRQDKLKKTSLRPAHESLPKPKKKVKVTQEDKESKLKKLLTPPPPKKLSEMKIVS